MHRMAIENPTIPSKASHFSDLAVSPSGHIYLYEDLIAGNTFCTNLSNKLHDLFSVGVTEGLLRLGIMDFNDPLPPSFAYWRKFSRIFITEVCKLSGLETLSAKELSGVSFPLDQIRDFKEQVPFMRGAEYVNFDMIISLWQDFPQALIKEISCFDGSFQKYLAAYNPAWNTVGRVCFHLAENKADSDNPFAFLATYTTRLSDTANLQHLPLGRALKEYSGDQKRSQLLSLLLPVQKAAEQSSFIKYLVDTSAIFQPLAWKTREAYQFLKSVPVIEEAGVMVRVPNWWNPRKPPRPQIKIAVGNAQTSVAGLDALLDFDMQFSLPDGEHLTLEELEELMENQGHLVQIKGQWIEVDRDKLDQVLSHWKKVEQDVKRDGLTFAEGMRLLAGVPRQQAPENSFEKTSEWSTVIEGSWLNETLTKLRHPEQTGDKSLEVILQEHLRANLRPYQLSGVHWLWFLYSLRLGGCLADDMGLGKTIQVLSLLLLVKHHSIRREKLPHLLILPASLLGNWQSEIKKFAPTLKIWIAHSSGTKDSPGSVKNFPDLSEIDLVLTTYAYAHRLPWLHQTSWDIVILDEAQNIKNPTSKQTQAIKKLPGRVRFILTGTPVENRLLDLWSLFNFIAPGLLGSSKAFSNYGKQTIQSSQNNEGEGRFYGAVRHLVAPYILRRLKSNKEIIPDLPDKTEIDAYCSLTKKQVAFYQQTMNDLVSRLEQNMDGIARRGLILTYLMRFKQICNHPSQCLGHGQYDEKESGKFIRLKEICEAIAAKQEKVLVFTQFREIIPALSAFLTGIFGQKGLILHGQTAIKDRMKMVDAFQQEQGSPFFVLSLKAGGTGLNLTNAGHVIHFDRWWNPAVENQATDRAYRMGQKRNVLVHKFICQGTIEEKIDALIRSKQNLSDELLTQSEGVGLTELDNEELMKIVTLDIHRALGET